MPFLYDFGASWRFTVKLESVNPLDEENPKPKVVAQKGKAPEEYPSFE